MEQIGIYRFDKGKDELGHGAFGRVYKGHDDQNKEVAIKVVKNTAIEDELKEIEVLQKLKNINNENLVRLLEFQKSGEFSYLVMDLCNAGDFGSFLYKYGNLNEGEIRHFFHQTSNGLSVLNQLNIVHRDLKPENMLLCNPRKLSSPKPQDLTLKVADFGLSKFLPNGAFTSTWCGTAPYMAPEVLLGQKYNSQADLWSVGMIIYESLTGSLPKYDESLNIEKNPLDANTYKERGKVQKKLGKYNEAIAEYTKAIELNPTDTDAYNNRGLAQHNLGKYNEAIADYTKAIELNPADAGAYNNRGLAQDNLGKYNEAIADCTKAIELMNPTHANAYNNRGFAQHNLGKYNEAIADCTKAIELNPTHANAYNNRAFAQYNLGQYNEAIADCTKAIELNSTHAYPYNIRGCVQEKLGNYNEAIADCTKAIELNPTHANAYFNRGNAQNNLGKYYEAIADYTKAIELNPNHADAYYNRGFAQNKLGKYDEAIADYTKAIELKPGFDLAINNLTKLMDKINFGK